MNKRFCRSRSDRMLGGVCGGIAQYLGIDPVWVRLFFVLLTLGDGIGVMVYILLWIVLPNEDAVDGNVGFRAGEFSQKIEEMGRDISNAAAKPNPNSIKFVGIGLVVLGLFALLKTLNLPWMHYINRELLFPAMLILGGGILLYQAFRKNGE